MKSDFLRLVLGGAAVAVMSTAAMAEPVDQGAADTRQKPTAFRNAPVVDRQVLSRATAREDMSMVAESRQSSTVSLSSVNGTTTTGEIIIADNAFQNANGLTVITANTGNNVAMNASLNVNIVIAERP